MGCKDCRSNKEPQSVSLFSGGTERGIGGKVLMLLENKRSYSAVTNVGGRVVNFSRAAVPMLVPAKEDGSKLACLFFF